MAPPKAREVVRINHSGNGTVATVVMKVENENGWGTVDQTLHVTELPRTELLRVVGMEYQGVRDWRRYSNDVIQEALIHGNLPDVIEVEEGHREEVPTPFVPTPTTPKTESTPPVTGDSDPLATALREAMAKVAAGTIDEQAVRDIVKAETESLIAEKVAEVTRPVVTMIQVNDNPPIEMGGRVHKDFQKVLQAVSKRKNLYLVGTPGTGKTTIAEQVAEALGLPFYAMSCHAQMPASAIFGYMDAQGNYVSTLFRKAYETGGVFLWDEFDNGNTNITASINAALANGVCAFPDGMVKKHPDFVCLAAGNTFGNGPDAMHIGRNALDKATIDRFVFTDIEIDEDIETEVTMALNPIHGAEWLEIVRTYRRRAAEHGLQVVISPRASFNGADLWAAGWSRQDCINGVLLKGMTSDQRAKLVG